MPSAFLAQPYGAEYEPVRTAIAAAAEEAGYTLVSPDSFLATESIAEHLIRQLAAADVVIGDVTGRNPNVQYELGLAQGTGRPMILITRDAAPAAFDVQAHQLYAYEPSAAGLEALKVAVRDALQRLARDPSALTPRSRANARTVFISYSHRDVSVLKRLLVHLRPLEKSGFIEPWNDTQIAAGSDWQREVEAALSRAAAAVLLVSADFLASDFIVDNELPPLLERAADEGTKIVPLILKPCRYTRDPALRRLQAINDPTQPLAGLPDHEQERLLDRVAQEIENAMRTG